MGEMSDTRISDLTTGERIRLLRSRAGLSQRALARAARISFQALGNYERDARDMPTSVLAKLAAVLEVSPNDLLDWDATDTRMSQKGQARPEKVLAHAAA